MTLDQEKNAKIVFNNGIINKRQLKNLMSCAFHNYGVVKSSIIADKVKNLTFHYATKSGISLSIEDLRIPQKKRSLIGLTNNEVETTHVNIPVEGAVHFCIPMGGVSIAWSKPIQWRDLLGNSLPSDCHFSMVLRSIMSMSVVLPPRLS